MAKKKIILEICIDSVESALAAVEGGGDRVELCQNLFEGGTTPSAGMIRAVKRAISIPVFVIIRPRGGDFCYSPAEFDVMKDDVLVAQSLGAEGIVVGILNPDGSVDTERMAELMALARPMQVTFHRAFDMTSDPFQALEDIIELGCERLLTSGQEKSVLEGIDLIQELVKAAEKRIKIMPGGGITEKNFPKIRKLSKATEFHTSGSQTIDSEMEYRHTRCFMGKELRPSEFQRSQVAEERVQAFRTLAD